jgi:basic membrane protein A
VWVRRRSLLILAAATLGLTACTGGPPGSPTGPTAGPTTTTSPTPTSPGAGKVGMAFDTGGRAEGSTNDLAAKGLEKAAKELGVDAKEVTPDAQGTNRAQLIRTFAVDGYNPIIAVGGGYAAAVDEVAAEFPSVQFVRIDGEPSTLPNVAVQSFAEHEGAFLVGAAAALRSATNHVGYIGSNQSPASNRSGAGFAQGARAITPTVIVADARLAPGVGATAGDAATARTAARSIYQNGADVIFTAAGDAYAGSFPAAVEAGKLAIGAGTDQWLTVPDPAWRPVILTSMVKRVDSAVYRAVAAFRSDRKVPTRTLGVKEDGVGYSTTGGGIDPATQARIDDIKAKIVSGDIVVEQS